MIESPFQCQFNLYSANLDEYEKYSYIVCTLGIDARQDSGENKRAYDLMLKFKKLSATVSISCASVTDEHFMLGPGNEVISVDNAK